VADWLPFWTNGEQQRKRQTRWHRRRTVTASTAKRRDVSSFCCRLHFPFVFPSFFVSFKCHIVDISVCFLPYNRRSWLLSSLFVCLKAVFVVPSSLPSSCPLLWFTVVISHTPCGVWIGGGYYWPYSHSGVRTNNLRLFALWSANKASLVISYVMYSFCAAFCIIMKYCIYLKCSSCCRG